MVKDEDFLPYLVSVSKEIEGNEYSVGAVGGLLSKIEEKLFASGSDNVILKNYYGYEIKYRKIRDESKLVGETNIPILEYFYESNKRIHDEELRRN
jgi:hypothetical protein